MTIVCTPDEPTETMIDAGLRVTMGYLSLPGSQLTQNRTKMRLRYQAMLSARPTRQVSDDLLDRLLDLDSANGGETIYATCATAIDHLHRITAALVAYHETRHTNDPKAIERAWETVMMLLPMEDNHGA